MATKRTPLRELPKAKTRPYGKKCINCKVRRAYSDFELGARSCKRCDRQWDKHRNREYRRECRFCDRIFTSSSARANCCGRAKCLEEQNQDRIERQRSKRHEKTRK